jgi:hypothetical protein
MVSFSKFICEWVSFRLRGLTYNAGECYFNAAKNLVSPAYKHLNLHWVCGSLGLAGHFEYGGKNWKAKDFKAKPNDSHAWLEDDEGNVYDYIFDRYAEFAKTWNKKPTFPTSWCVEGISKADLKEEGLEYVPASEEATEVITTFVHTMARQRLQWGMMTQKEYEAVLASI